MKVSTSIAIATIYLFVFALMPLFNLHLHAIYWFMFSLSPFIVIGLVLNVLMNGKPSEKKFDEGYFYEDREKQF